MSCTWNGSPMRDHRESEVEGWEGVLERGLKRFGVKPGARAKRELKKEGKQRYAVPITGSTIQRLFAAWQAADPQTRRMATVAAEVGVSEATAFRYLEEAGLHVPQSKRGDTTRARILAAQRAGVNSVQDLASTLGLSTTTVYSHLQRAQKKGAA